MTIRLKPAAYTGSVILGTALSFGSLGLHDGTAQAKQTVQQLPSAEIQIAREKNRGTLNTRLETISGIPLSIEHSVTGTPYGMLGYLSTVVEVDNKKVLASLYTEAEYRNLINAAALIESEINDHDQEKMTLKGTYQNNRFYISELEANGYKITF